MSTVAEIGVERLTAANWNTNTRRKCPQRPSLALTSGASSGLHLHKTNCVVKKSAWNIKNGANVASFLAKPIFSSQKWNTARGAGRGRAFEGVRFALPALKWFRCKWCMAGYTSVSANEASAFYFTFKKEKKQQQMLLKKYYFRSLSTKSRSCNSFTGYFFFPLPSRCSPCAFFG